ncbi:maleylacetoacetate isomerase [Xanthomonas vesicatoria]|uniref:maleylacetoacetate isomerase n=1 Tax=Xanthomonas vesicatoria TaxID=56460 RepID=UPI00073218A8|nr:maleylacetoacetate isomerase [Xanthomonas vesicatoria]KTF37428.1 maleylacetoacetate isomerase [Xanthomonas vesicatoria]MCC8559600.1 maleylacetoacetate isomerase [Xanthomonas vesicatoria]MCC8602598.1 maleylacetoacetate isomerase [Xanthomonas vesicatoria]MCC8611103.1 maleylacetoacetate isomerase [Xanthomonas vesicatoria]MCC8675270.1 maleylacetoacetate isomerase [Xanthomonas vesicatoria]
MSAVLELFSYWRSSAAYRVRIGLQLKALDHLIHPVHLVREGGEQHAPAYAQLNPQELVPTLRHGAVIISQSLAILEYLEEAFADTAALLPSGPVERARVRALAQLIACDVHPLNNLRVTQLLEHDFALEAAQRLQWTRHWMQRGFAALETQLARDAQTGRFCHGDVPRLADCVLIPQLYNAHRFNVDLAPYPTLQRIEQACLALPAFDMARPEMQFDAVA